MKIKPDISPLAGVVYFRDALTVESTRTVGYEAILDRNSQLLLFQFEDCHLCFDVASLHLCVKVYNDLSYTDNYNGQECTLTYFFIQEMAIADDSIFFVSGVFDIGDGLDYRIFRIHGYFSASGREVTAKPGFSLMNSFNDHNIIRN